MNEISWYDFTHPNAEAIRKRDKFMSEIELKIKPCPWCGDRGIVVFEPIHGYDGNHFYYVKCFKCGTTAPKEYKFNDIYQTSEEAVEKAIEVWNKRE